MRQDRRNSKGFALLIVLVLVAIAGTMGLSYLSAASVKVNSSANMAASVRCRYLAEAGIEHALQVLRTDTSSLPGSGSAAGPFQLDSGDGSYWFWGQATDEEGEYLLIARGGIGSITRELSATARVRSGYYDQMMDLDPLCYWRMDDQSGLICEDVKGTQNGVYRNGPELDAEGVLGGSDSSAVDFDGNDDYVDLGYLDIAGSALTLMAWVQPVDLPGADPKGYILSKTTGPSPGKHIWSLSTYPNSNQRHLRFYLQTAGDKTVVLDAETDPLLPGQWYHVAAVYDGATMKLYVNGNEVATTPQIGEVVQDDTVPAWIGDNPENPNTRPWPGTLDEAAILDKAVTAEQLQVLYDSRSATLEIVRWHD